MRIVAGTHKGVRIFAPKGIDTRFAELAAFGPASASQRAGS